MRASRTVLGCLPGAADLAPFSIRILESLIFELPRLDSSGKAILASPSVDSAILELPYVVLPCLVGFLALRIVAPLVADLGGGGLGISPLSTADASRLTWLVQSSSEVEEDALGAPAAAG